MPTKHQHYVPKHYLEGWSVPSQSLAVWNDARPCRMQSVSNTATATKIYSLTVSSLEECERILTHCKNQGYPEDIARLLFQSCVYPVWREHIVRKSISEQDVAIAKFIKENELASRDKISFLSDWLRNQDLDNPPCDWNQYGVTEGLEPFFSTVEKDFWPILNGIRANPDYDFYRERHKVYLYLATQIYRTPKFNERFPQLSPMDRLLISLDRLLWMVRCDSRYKFTIFSIPNSREFLTCDNPVVDYGFMKSELFFPISPKLGLFCYLPNNPFRLGIDSKPENVSELNRIICENADTEIYATSFDTMQKEAHPFGAFKNSPYLSFKMRFDDVSNMLVQQRAKE